MSVSVWAAGEWQPVAEGSSYSLTAGFTDTTAHGIDDYHVDWGDGTTDGFPGAAGAEGSCTFSHTYYEPSSYAPTVYVDAGGVQYGPVSTTASISEAQPSLTATASTGVVDEGSVYALDTSFFDPGHDVPSSIEVDWGDGASDTFTGADAASASGVSLEAEHVYDEPSTYTPTLVVQTEDGTYSCNGSSVTVHEVAPTFSVFASSSAVEASTYWVGASFNDPGGDTVSWTVNYGDRLSDSITGVSDASDGFSHVYSESGSYTVTVSGTSEEGSFYSSFVVSVGDAAIAVGLTGDGAVSEGSTYTISDGFCDPGGDTPSEMLFDWGDGHSNSFDHDPSSATHAYSEEGSYTVTATAFTENGSASSTFNVQVLGVPPVVSASGPLTVQEGSTYTLTTSFSDPADGDPAQGWAILWDDGSSNSYTGDPGTYTHVYSEPGSYVISATATTDDGPLGAADLSTSTYTDSNGNTIIAGGVDSYNDAFRATLPVTVTEAAPTFSVYNPGGSVNAGSTATFSVSFSDPAGDTVDTYIVDFGDGTGDHSYAGSTTTFSHTYAKGGASFIVNVVAETEDGPFDQDTSFSILAPTGSPGSDFSDIFVVEVSSAPEGSPLYVTFSANDLDDGGGGGDSSYTIDFGDGTAPASANGSVDGSGVFHGSASHTYTEEGKYPVTVADNDGGSASSWVTVDDAPASISPVPGITVHEGSSVSFSTTFSDAGSGEYDRAWIDWGDGRGYQAATIGAGNVIRASTPQLPAGSYAGILALATGDAAGASAPVATTVQAAAVQTFTATDAANAQNTVTVTSAVAGNIYVAEATAGPNVGKAQLIFSGTTTPANGWTLAMQVRGSAANPATATFTGTQSQVVLTLNPSVAASGTNPVAWRYIINAISGGSVQRTIIVHVFRLEMTGYDSVVKNFVPLTSPPQAGFVGRKVSLQYDYTGDHPTASSQTWTIPGSDGTGPAAMKSYTQTLSAGTKTSLGPADLSASRIDFYWTAAASSQSVSVAVNFPGGLTSSVAEAFNIGTPTVTKFVGSSRGKDAVDVSVFRSGERKLHYGSSQFPNTQGIYWDAQVSDPAGGLNGQIQIVQVGTIQTSLMDNNNAPYTATTPPNQIYVDPHQMKDGSLIVSYVPATAITAGGGATKVLDELKLTPGDSPQLSFNASTMPFGTYFTSMTAEQHFTDYLMYKPDPDGVWVSLGTMSWFWKGSGTFDGLKGLLVDKSNDATAGDVSYTPTATLPEWTGQLRSLIPPKKQ